MLTIRWLSLRRFNGDRPLCICQGPRMSIRAADNAQSDSSEPSELLIWQNKASSSTADKQGYIKMILIDKLALVSCICYGPTHICTPTVDKA